MPEPTDIIILEPGDEGWTYRYAPPVTEADGALLFGHTPCCRRTIAAPGALIVDAHAAAARGKFPHIDDCCDRPYRLYGPKPVELPPYTGEHATCRKCGSKAVETKFTTRGGDSADRYGIPRGGYPPEWLARRCAVCQATWDEAIIAEPASADASARLAPHGAAPWSVWGIGDTWWVHHSPSGMFLPIIRGGEMLTPAELVEAGARPLGRGGAA